MNASAVMPARKTTLVLLVLLAALVLVQRHGTAEFYEGLTLPSDFETRDRLPSRALIPPDV